MDAEQDLSSQFSEPENLDKLFFQILNFLDAKTWYPENLWVRLSTEMLF